MLVRDLFERHVSDFEAYEYSRPEDENEALQAAVERLMHDMHDVTQSKDTDDLVSRLANLKEIVDVIDMFTNRQVSVRQVNLRKKYGGYTDMLLATDLIEQT